MRSFIRKVRKRLGLHRRYKTEKWGDYLMTFAPSTDIGGKLYRGEKFEQREIDIACKFIRDNATVLDIGANIGIHALHFSRAAKSGMVVAFEPQPKTFALLKKNIDQNNVSNIIPLNLAVDTSSKFSEFYVMSDDAYSSLIDTGRKALVDKIQVLCTTVDSLIGNIDIDFVKIDVEGLEFNVLQSMDGLISRCMPIIFCEIYKGKVAANNPELVITSLVAKGYEVNRVVDGELVPFLKDDVHDDRFFNYFFVPRAA